MNDTGESTRSINRRSDDAAWAIVETMLRNGAQLRRPPGLKRYYPYRKDVPTMGSLSETRVRKLLDEGVLERLGEHIYGIKESACP
jgi:hypothetical protein